VRRRRLQGSHQSAKPETAPQLQELAKCDSAMREAFIAPETDAAPSAESNSGDRGGKHKPGFAYAARLFLRIWTMAFKVAAAPSVLIKGLHCQSSHCNSSHPDSTSDNRQRGSRVRRRRLQGSHQSAKPETAPQLQELAKFDSAIRDALSASQTSATHLID
jgi:hypothetical protein